MKNNILIKFALLALPVMLLNAGCSVNRWALHKAGTALSGAGSSTVFTGEDDPELVGDALPLIIKTHELLLEKDPDNPELLLATGRIVCMYAYAFIQMPAEELPETEALEKERRMARARKLFLRSRGYLLHGLEVRHPGFSGMLGSGAVDPALALTGAADTSLLYWAGAAWMSAISADKSDMALIVDIPKAAALVARVLALNETYDRGSAHEFMCSYYGSLSAAMGGSADKARQHFKRALELSGYSRVGPYVSLAASVCVTEQNLNAYRTLLQQALKVDLDRDPSQRLVNTLYQRRARWMLDHTGDFFLLDEGEGQ